MLGNNLRLLDLDLGTCGLDLFLDLFSDFFLDAFGKLRWGLLNECLCFCKAQAGNHRADFLNDGDLIRATFSKDNVEFGLRFSSRSSSSSTTTSGSNGHRCSGAHAPLGFKGLYEFSNFKDGESAEFIYDFV